MDLKTNKTRFILILLFPLGLALFYLSPYIPTYVERFYSRGLYKLIAQPLSLFTGLFPFSVAEVGLVLIIAGLLWQLGLLVVKLFQRSSSRGTYAVRFISGTLALVSLTYFSFVALWGLNYNRLSFAEISGLEVKPSTVDELVAVCEDIIKQANNLKASIDNDSAGVMKLSDGYRGAFKRAGKGYAVAAKTYPELGGSYGRPKPVLLSDLMSYTGIEGVFCPFTYEANIDIAIPDSSIPATTMHEMAHQRGFNREDEANYIAYLTSISHPDKDFQYSGTLLALIYSMNSLYEHDSGKFGDLRKTYSEGVVKDLNARRVYWEVHEGTVENITNSINNAYLKANRQEDGVYSYGRMVDLLIADYRNNTR